MFVPFMFLLRLVGRSVISSFQMFLVMKESWRNKTHITHRISLSRC